MKGLRWSMVLFLLPVFLAGCGGKGGGAGEAGGSRRPVTEGTGCLREHQALRQQEFAWQAGVVEAYAYASRDCGATLEEVKAVAQENDR